MVGKDEGCDEKTGAVYSSIICYWMWQEFPDDMLEAQLVVKVDRRDVVAIKRVRSMGNLEWISVKSQRKAFAHSFNRFS